MWNLVKLVLVSSFIVSFVSCETKMSPYGEPLGPLGPTIVEKPYKVNEDVANITEAISKQNWDLLATIITQRTLKQRLEIDRAFKKASKTNKDISTSVNDILNKRHDYKSRLLVADVFTDLPILLAQAIRNSFDYGGGNGDWLYMSIICTGSKTKLKAVMDVYENATGTKLDEYIHKDMGRKGAKLAINRMVRPESMRPDSGYDPKLVDGQLKLIPSKQTGGCDGYDLEVFLTGSSFEQIKQVFTQWKNNNRDKSVAQPFRDHCDKGLRQEMYKRIVRYAYDPYEYLAELLYLGLVEDRFNTDADSYVLLTRSEIDLKDVLASFKQKYGNFTSFYDNWFDRINKKVFIDLQNGNTGK